MGYSYNTPRRVEVYPYRQRFFNKEYQYQANQSALTAADLAAFRLPGFEQANELVYINGRYAPDVIGGTFKRT